MKILVNLTTVGKNGTYPRVISKIKTFLDLKATVSIHCGNFIAPVNNIKNTLTFNQTFPWFQKIPTYKLTRLNFIVDAIKKNFNSIVRLSQFKNFDVIYTTSSVLDLVITPFFAKVFYPKIIWVTVFDNIVPFTDPGNKLIRLLAWIFFQISLVLIRFSDKIFVSTPELMTFLISKKYPPNILYQTHLAIENDLIRDAKPNPKIKIDSLYIGRINETKGIYDLLEMMKIVTRKFPHFQLAIMGEGDEITVRKFNDKITQFKLSKNINFLGFVPESEKYNIIKSSKTFVFLSKSDCESFGLALFEAVCSGLPAFAYDLPPFKTIYQNNEVDISPIGDYKTVANKIIKTFENNNFTNLKGKILLGKYSWENIAKKELLEIIKLIHEKT
ncbi:MAG: glycosyltransferase [Candidatus Shapirobacteria bacterium]|jgi:glycosyltransferase involved in cell wall biosynthesis